MSVSPILAVIPCRGGSKGLPGKNIRKLAGLPLVAHSIRFANSCPEIARLIVSTDNEEIANVAREHGGEAPFLRPRELAQDETPMWPVLQHALGEMERGMPVAMAAYSCWIRQAPGACPPTWRELYNYLKKIRPVWEPSPLLNRTSIPGGFA